MLLQTGSVVRIEFRASRDHCRQAEMKDCAVETKLCHEPRINTDAQIVGT